MTNPTLHLINGFWEIDFARVAVRQMNNERIRRAVLSPEHVQ